MSSPASGIVSTPTIYGKVDFGPTLGWVYRPINQKRTAVPPVNKIVQVLPFDSIILIFDTSGTACTLQLPDVRDWSENAYGGFDLIIKYYGTADLTVLPVAGQNINSVPSLIVGGQGVSGPVGSVIITPYYNKQIPTLAVPQWMSL